LGEDKFARGAYAQADFGTPSSARLHKREKFHETIAKELDVETSAGNFRPLRKAVGLI